MKGMLGLCLAGSMPADKVVEQTLLFITPLTKLGELEKFAHHVCTHITSKRIELEGPGWSGLVRF